MQPLVVRLALELPLFASRVEAGFQSPADDYIEAPLDLGAHVIQHPAATYYVRANGDSMTGLGIFSGDLLVVDRALEAKDRDVVIAAINGELTCKVLDEPRRQLLSTNRKFQPIPITEEMELVVEGVVTFCVRDLRVRR